MAGIYIHIPFCKQKCIYCNFYSIPSLAEKETFLKALLNEILIQKNYLSSPKISTIYFGGGTPSVLSYSEIDRIFTQLTTVFTIDSNAEITFEANPEHLNENYLKQLKELGYVNRVSIGIQSFSNEALALLNRKHSSDQAVNSVLNAQKIGFENISVDLIYGIPIVDTLTWQQQLENVFSLNVQHLSSYALTVEPNTMLDQMIKKGIIKPVCEQQTVEQFDVLQEMTAKNGFIQYEISNFCKPNFESKHNSNYWNGTCYLGLGASAHSFNGYSRQWNINNVKSYISAIETDSEFYEKEILTQQDVYNEYVMTALRTNKGISKSWVKEKFPENYNQLKQTVLSFIKNNWVEETSNSFVLTPKGKLFADKIASDLFC